jgi:hypothetical protein
LIRHLNQPLGELRGGRCPVIPDLEIPMANTSVCRVADRLSNANGFTNTNV